MSQPSVKTLAAVINVQIDDSQNQKTLARSIAAYLVEQRRTKDTDRIMREVVVLREAKGVLEANVTGAHPLTPGLRQDIHNLLASLQLTRTKVVLNETVDSSVIGGVRIEATGRRLDLTLQTKLKRLKSAAA